MWVRSVKTGVGWHAKRSLVNSVLPSADAKNGRVAKLLYRQLPLDIST